MWTSKVRQWLKQNDRKQAWLARKANIPESHLSKVMNGKLMAGEVTLKKLEEATGLDLSSDSNKTLARAS